MQRLGARVRELRREQGLTLKGLGRAAGLSHPFLSQLERGLARPSVGSLERIADALGVSIGVLWAGARPAAVRLVRAADGERNGGARRLTPASAPLHAVEWSGADAWPADAERRAGAVLLYVVRGEVELELEGTVHVLEEADALLFDGAVPHRLRRSGDSATRALYVAAPA